MKVVGGPHDGINVWVRPGLITVKLINPNNESAVIDSLCSECGRAVMADPGYTVYTVRSILRDDIEFLAPQDWSMAQALRHLLCST